MDRNYDQPPTPTDRYEAARWQTTRRRHRLLTGQWDYDLESRLLLQFGSIRRGAIGPQSKALNLFKRICEELSVLHLEPPVVDHEAGELDEFLSQDGLLYRAGLWPQMRRTQVHTLGEREQLVRIGWSERSQRPVFQRVSPATVLAWSSSADPGVPIRLQALLWFPSVAGHGQWAWETWDITDPDQPFHAVYEYSAKEPVYNIGRDITSQVFGERDDYPWRRTRGPLAGMPEIPWVTYHADMPDSLWDPWTWEELIDGALDVACQGTHFGHLQFRASWAQRVLVDGEVQGVKVEDTVAGTRQDIPADATSALLVKTDPDVREKGQQARIESWSASQMREFIEAMDMFVRMVSDVAGVDAAHIVRGSSDAWSGAALSVSRDGKREAQSVYGPQFRRSDEELLGKAAMVCNVFGGFDLPEDGYRVRYRSIPMSPQERKAMREHHKEMIDAGLMSKVDAVLEQNPGMTRDQAKAQLLRIQAENAEYAPGMAPTPERPSLADDAGATP